MTVDVCIVGAGPAGLAVATSLAHTSTSVCLLESGPADGEPDILDDVELLAEDPYPGHDIRSTRAGTVGGTAAMWSFRLAAAGDDSEGAARGCRYLPLEPLDLERRTDVGTPGWPLTRGELDPWYASAQALCQLGELDYSVTSWADSTSDTRPLPLEESGVVSSMFQFGPASAFTTAARAAVEAAPNVELRAQTRALRLELDPLGGHVTGVRVLGADGLETTVVCRRVVLAAGTIENIRLLLDSGRHSAATPGNSHDLVGRYFMEHPLVRGGLLVTDPARGFIRDLGLYATRQVRGTWVSALLTIDENVRRREGLLGCSALLVPRDRSFGGAGAQAFARLRSPSGRTASRAQRVRLAAAVVRDARSVLGAAQAVRRGQPNLDQGTWGGPDANPDLSVFELVHQTEQTPQADNRLDLTTHRDEHDRSRMSLTWRWSEHDQERVRRSRDIFADALERAGLGRVVLRDWDRGRPRMLGGTHHHLGGLRMAADPRDGVVDADCRVHGVDNLFVAGGAVFPSGGFANPTLTVVALALRLGERLRR